MSQVLSDKEIIERARKGIVKTPYQAKRLVELLESSVCFLLEIASVIEWLEHPKVTQLYNLLYEEEN